jgi:hypothetical protein
MDIHLESSCTPQAGTRHYKMVCTGRVLPGVVRRSLSQYILVPYLIQGRTRNLRHGTNIENSYGSTYWYVLVCGDVVAYWSRHRAGNRLIAGSTPIPARQRWRPCGAALDAVLNLMVGYINKGFLYCLVQ